MKQIINSIIIIIVFSLGNNVFCQNIDNEKSELIKKQPAKRISIYTEPVEGVYKNFWYVYKLDNREIAIISEGKTKGVRSYILFNCNNEKYVIYAATNFGYNITEEEFKDIVPSKVIDLSRSIMCSNN